MHRPRIDRAGRWADRAFRGHAIVLFLFLYVPIGLVVLFSFNAGERTGELRGLSLRWYEKALSDEFALKALGNSFDRRDLDLAHRDDAGHDGRPCPQPGGAAGAGRPGGAHLHRDHHPGDRDRDRHPDLLRELLRLAQPVARVRLEGFGLGAPPIVQSGLHTIIGAHVVFTMAIVFVLVRARLSGMDRSLVEASADLFATPWRTLRQITIPQLRPAILAGALLSFTFSFDDYILASFVQGPGQPTLPLYVFGSIRRGITPQINAIASLILLVTLSVLTVAYVTYRRQAR